MRISSSLNDYFFLSLQATSESYLLFLMQIIFHLCQQQHLYRTSDNLVCLTEHHQESHLISISDYLSLPLACEAERTLPDGADDTEENLFTFLLSFKNQENMKGSKGIGYDDLY